MRDCVNNVNSILNVKVRIEFYVIIFNAKISKTNNFSTTGKSLLLNLRWINWTDIWDHIFSFTFLKKGQNPI